MGYLENLKQIRLDAFLDDIINVTYYGIMPRRELLAKMGLKIYAAEEFERVLQLWAKKRGCDVKFEHIAIEYTKNNRWHDILEGVDIKGKK